FRAQLRSIKLSLRHEGTASRDCHIIQARMYQELVQVYVQGWKRNECSVVTGDCRPNEKWVVRAFAQANCGGCLPSALPSYSCLGISTLGDVDQVSQPVDFLRINRNIGFGSTKTLSGEFTFVLGKVWRRPRPIRRRRRIVPRIDDCDCQKQRQT